MRRVPRRALLLAAGFGSRLKPLTDDIPKCLVPIQGRPLLGIWLSQLVNSGVEEILVNTHYLPQKVEDYVHDSPWKKQVRLVHEEKLLGTAGTLFSQEAFLAGEPFFLAHADNLSSFVLEDFYRAHQHRPPQCLMTMMTFTTDTPASCGILQLDGRGVMVDYVEKAAHPPPGPANGAVYIMEAEIFTAFRAVADTLFDISKDIIPRCKGQVFTFHNDRYHRDIGTPESFAAAQSLELPGATGNK